MEIEIRADQVIIKGYVNAVGRDSRVLSKNLSPKATSNFVETVTPKTFERALSKGNNVELRFNHGSVLASTDDKTLKLREDNIGLYAESVVTDPNVIDKARKNELRGWSFGFITNVDKWEDNGDIQRRSLEDIDLKEVSLLDKTPAYIATSIEMRGENCFITEKRSIEDDVSLIDNTPNEAPKIIDNSNKKKEIEILKMRGSNY